VIEERGSSAITQQVTQAKHVLLTAHVEDQLGMTQVLLAWQTRALCGRSDHSGTNLWRQNSWPKLLMDSQPRGVLFRATCTTKSPAPSKLSSTTYVDGQVNKNMSLSDTCSTHPHNRSCIATTHSHRGSPTPLPIYSATLLSPSPFPSTFVFAPAVPFFTTSASPLMWTFLRIDVPNRRIACELKKSESERERVVERKQRGRAS
jgi:hypothetical protein